jgi:hypothetical protein
MALEGGLGSSAILVPMAELPQALVDVREPAGEVCACSRAIIRVVGWLLDCGKRSADGTEAEIIGVREAVGE